MLVGQLQIDVPVVLAPMAAVTDLPFRTICEEHGVGFTITEFLSAHAMVAGAEKTLEKMQPSLEGRPFGVQIFGREPDVMVQAALMAVNVGCSLLDINMGCPAKRVVAGACGSALMKEPQLAMELVRTVRAAVPAHIPVTVKHRAGWDDRNRNAAEFAVAMVEGGAAMITVHGRTRTQGFSGTCDLNAIRAVRAAVPAHVPVVGNGDVTTVAGFLRMREETGCDAVMIGRGAMGNPWLFRSLRAVCMGENDPGPPTIAERVMVFERHIVLLEQHLSSGRKFAEVRKACAWYIRGLENSGALRKQLWETQDSSVILDRTRRYFQALAVSPGRRAWPVAELREPEAGAALELKAYDVGGVALGATEAVVA